jgi:hypothetical protein
MISHAVARCMAVSCSRLGSAIAVSSAVCRGTFATFTLADQKRVNLDRSEQAACQSGGLEARATRHQIRGCQGFAGSRLERLDSMALAPLPTASIMQIACAQKQLAHGEVCGGRQHRRVAVPAQELDHSGADVVFSNAASKFMLDKPSHEEFLQQYRG